LKKNGIRQPDSTFHNPLQGLLVYGIFLLSSKSSGIINGELVKSPKILLSVIPAKLVPAGFKPGAGIQLI
jgi:hypothetical protein